MSQQGFASHYLFSMFRRPPETCRRIYQDNRDYADRPMSPSSCGSLNSSFGVHKIMLGIALIRQATVFDSCHKSMI